MRTTLTLDDDVAARLKQLEGFSSFKEAVNAALREGLEQLTSPSKESTQPYKIQSVPLQPLISNIDNIADVLEIIEAET